MPRISPWQKFTSERSGFDTKRIAVIKDGPILVDPGEFDEPPPSRISLGGEGDISQGDMRPNATGLVGTNTANGYGNPVVYVTAAGGIVPSFTQPFMLITGSNQAVKITKVPQIVVGQQNQVLTLWCVDSGITISNGTGVTLMGSVPWIMTSGCIISFIYNTGGNAWQETSRSRCF